MRFIPNEIIVEIFSFLNRRFLETRIGLVSRLFHQIIRNKFKITPYLVLVGMDIDIYNRLTFWMRERSYSAPHLSMTFDEFHHENYLSNFPNYLRAGHIYFLTTSQATVSMTEESETVFDKLRKLWDGYEYVSVDVEFRENNGKHVFNELI